MASDDDQGPDATEEEATKPTGILKAEPIICSTLDDVKRAAGKFGYPVQLKIKDSIEITSKADRKGLASVRIVERDDEAVSVAGVMIRNHELLRKMQRGRRLSNMERESQMIQTNIHKIEKDPQGDQAKAKRLKSVLSQCNGDISKFKQATSALKTEILVTPSSRAAHTIADYRGQPLWDPEMQTHLMECDRATAVLRAAYTGDMGIIAQLGISKELLDEHEGAAGRQRMPGILEEERGRVGHVLEQMNQIDTTDAEHHLKAQELTDEWNTLDSRHKVACTRAEQSVATMSKLRAKLSKTASSSPKVEPDAHSSRQVVEEEEELDVTGLDQLPTVGQRRVEEEVRRRGIKDRRDARAHPKCKTLTEQINAANNAHSKYAPLLTAAASASKPLFDRLVDTGAIFLTAAKLEETTTKRQHLATLKAQQRKYEAEIESKADVVAAVTLRIDKGESTLSYLRQTINALPNSDQTKRISLNKQLNSQQRELRDMRVSKVNVQRDMDLITEEKTKQAQVLPIVVASLEILESGLGDGAWNTPLHRACQMNHEWHVKALLEARALPDAVDIYGDTPLHMAVSFGYHESIRHFSEVLDSETLNRTLATQNMYGQRPFDLAQDPMCRIELRKAVLKIDRCVETPFMRIGLDAQEQVIDDTFARAQSNLSRGSGSFSRTASSEAHMAQILPSALPLSVNGGGKTVEEKKGVGDVTFDADMKRAKRCYPSTITPYTGPPYAREVVFVNPYAADIPEKEEASSK